eukprot:CAMPEP_0171080332 /NCGR_PEP_ID=MMETSP0766_2-20121228/15802_1 /TAXON_ID=439317 /ORGANISM="Gambierdiscus australes, Strain CAWD 149" /LENGTH=46 /DNA_ID= /DNA_START= /DNA_END= /DNA_ORIENTATION=
MTVARRQKVSESRASTSAVHRDHTERWHQQVGTALKKRHPPFPALP